MQGGGQAALMLLPLVACKAPRARPRGGCRMPVLASAAIICRPPDRPPTYPPDPRRRCDKCSLSGEGTIDGRARHWVLASRAGAGGRAGRQVQAAELLRGEASLSVLGEEAAAVGVSGEDSPRKTVRNWQDPSCPKPEECR